MDEQGIGHNSGPVDAGALQAFVDRITDLENDKRAAMEDIKDICAEAKSFGYDPKAIKSLVRESLMDASAKAKRESEAAIEELYRAALGMN